MFPDVAMSTRSFRIDGMMRCSLFVPRLYNLCLSLGFDPGTIMPSRAFCADESQGFPIILIPKHFGAFPFAHGRAGGGEGRTNWISTGSRRCPGSTG